MDIGVAGTIDAVADGTFNEGLGDSGGGLFEVLSGRAVSTMGTMALIKAAATATSAGTMICAFRHQGPFSGEEDEITGLRYHSTNIDTLASTIMGLWRRGVAGSSSTSAIQAHTGFRHVATPLRWQNH
jgi:hypothetical protein